MIIFQSTQYLSSFSYMPGLQRHMRSVELELQSGALIVFGDDIRIEMKFAQGKTLPSNYSLRMSSRRSKTKSYESAMMTETMDWNIPEISKSEFGLDKNGFGIAIFHAKDYEFSVSISREAKLDAKGFNSNQRTQPKELTIKQMKEIALKIQPEWKQFLKTWQWKNEIRQELYFKRKSK